MSFQLTPSTGQLGPHSWKLLGLSPITASHWPWVISYLPIQKPCLKVTLCRGASFENQLRSALLVYFLPSASAPSISAGVEPIMKDPAGTKTNSMPSELVRTVPGAGAAPFASGGTGSVRRAVG